MKYVHEHFFEVYDPFLLDHSCRESLLVKCANCSDISVMVVESGLIIAIGTD